MKFLLIFISLMITYPVSANDEYYNAKPEWRTEFNINNNVNVKSVNKLKSYHIRLVENTYNLTEEKFLKFWDLKQSDCKFKNLKVKIVKNHYELDSREFFPHEFTYADKPEEGTGIIFGRYFITTNTLYIVPPYNNKYYWRDNFAHELNHYFFDECDIKLSRNKQHEEIEKFIKKYKKLFY